jgi:hypothetical protein
MRFGAWFHPQDDLSLEDQFRTAHACGIRSVRSYSIDYSEQAAGVISELGMNLYAGMHVDAEELIRDWRSQVRLDELERIHRLGVELDAICVGNELRQYGDDPERKRFSARVAYGLANVLRAYRAWLDERGLKTPLTYAMEGIVFDRNGTFHEHVWPVVDACDIVSINLYPMGASAWHAPDQFEESRLFLQDDRPRRNRMLAYEVQLRAVLESLEGLGKSVVLSETGFPSAQGVDTDEMGLLRPITDSPGYERAMEEMLGIIDRANTDYGSIIRTVYFYEWRDNPYHSKIANEEHSPIHCAFGLCDRSGKPKFDIPGLLAKFRG